MFRQMSKGASYPYLPVGGQSGLPLLLSIVAGLLLLFLMLVMPSSSMAIAIPPPTQAEADPGPGGTGEEADDDEVSTSAAGEKTIQITFQLALREIKCIPIMSDEMSNPAALWSTGPSFWAS